MAEQTETLRTSDGWTRWMATAAKFHSYSMSNQMLIARQTCGTATFVCGFHGWRQLGRNVRKGEKGIAIFAPIVRRVTADTRTVEVDSEPSVESRRVSGFRVAYVFDYSQTEGEPLEIPVMPVLDEPGREQLHGSLCETVRASGLDLVFTSERRGDARGWYEANSKRLTIVDAFPIASQCRTLLHELAHSFDPRCHGAQEATRAEQELVAESVAYIVGTRFGLALDESSAIYGASWGADTGQLRTLAESVLRISGRLEEAITKTANLVIT